MLADAGPTVATAGNLNNELGVPLTVLRADPTRRYLVVEMGARGIGHIAYLCEIAPPSVAAVINVGTAHIGEFGSREAIAAGQGRDRRGASRRRRRRAQRRRRARVAAMASRTEATRAHLRRAAATSSWRGVELDDLGRPTFELGYDGTWLPVTLTQTGRAPGRQRGGGRGDGPRGRACRSPTAVGDSGRPPCPPRAGGWRCASAPTDCSWSTTPTTPTPRRCSPRWTPWRGSARGSGRRTVAVLGEMLELGADCRRVAPGGRAGRRGGRCRRRRGRGRGGARHRRGRVGADRVERHRGAARRGATRRWRGCARMSPPRTWCW